MNVCKVPDMCKDMEYKYITEDSKTRVYLSVVREFNEAEYEKYYIRKKKEKVRKRILFIAKDTDSHGTLYGSWLQHGIRADLLLHKL